jgi:uncharacterized protein (DUF427 family)
MSLERQVPLPGQESVWDYPRPPRLEDSPARIRVIADDLLIADSTRTKRVLETSHPPVYYIPPDDVEMQWLVKTDHRSWCEWKGLATYYSLVLPGDRRENAAWCYHDPTASFDGIRHYLAFYPSKVGACFVGEEQVQAQEGDFYGGWITSKIVGPFKGGPGTRSW